MKAGGILIAIVVFIILLRQFISSAFIVHRDRIQVVIYGAQPTYFSLERNGTIHYVTTFAADSRTSVPGGYEVYRMGGLGKLAELERRPDILQRTFSRITGSMTDYYFYPREPKIYYGSSEEFSIPKTRDILFLRSNANIFDRLYILLQFAGKRPYSFDRIAIKKIQKKDITLLSDDTFARQYLGFFYQKSLRKENKTVQILYKKAYSAAKNMSRVIDGVGIRVVDIDKDDTSAATVQKRCVVMEQAGSGNSKTALRLSEFFRCDLRVGEGSLSDIVVYLNSLEKDWE